MLIISRTYAHQILQLQMIGKLSEFSQVPATGHGDLFFCFQSKKGVDVGCTQKHPESLELKDKPVDSKLKENLKVSGQGQNNKVRLP